MIDNICVCWTALAIVLYYTFFLSCSMSVRWLVKFYANSSTKTILSYYFVFAL